MHMHMHMLHAACCMHTHILDKRARAQVMLAVLHLMPDRDVDAPTAALEALAEGEYAELSPNHKLSLLSALCDTWLSCWTT